jgi:hypothetical protein
MVASSEIEHDLAVCSLDGQTHISTQQHNTKVRLGKKSMTPRDEIVGAFRWFNVELLTNEVSEPEI